MVNLLGTELANMCGERKEAVGSLNIVVQLCMTEETEINSVQLNNGDRNAH